MISCLAYSSYSIIIEFTDISHRSNCLSVNFQISYLLLIKGPSWIIAIRIGVAFCNSLWLLYSSTICRCLLPPSDKKAQPQVPSVAESFEARCKQQASPAACGGGGSPAGRGSLSLSGSHFAWVSVSTLALSPPSQSGLSKVEWLRILLMQRMQDNWVIKKHFLKCFLSLLFSNSKSSTSISCPILGVLCGGNFCNWLQCLSSFWNRDTLAGQGVCHGHLESEIYPKLRLISATHQTCGFQTL